MNWKRGVGRPGGRSVCLSVTDVNGPVAKLSSKVRLLDTESVILTSVMCRPGSARFDSALQPSTAGILISITTGLPVERCVFD